MCGSHGVQLRTIGSARCNRADKFATPPALDFTISRDDVADGSKSGLGAQLYPGVIENWRATADEDGHYSFAVAL
jgi:hypothetical protein